jgi:hypothetical protein
LFFSKKASFWQSYSLEWELRGSLSQLKQFFWRFSLGLGLMLGLSVLGGIDYAALAFFPGQPRAIATVSELSQKPMTLIIAQNALPPSTQPTNSSVNGQENPTNTPLVSKGPDHLIYIGLFLLVVTLINVAGLFSKKVKSALIFSSVLSVILIALLWFF